MSGHENTYAVWGDLTLPCDVTIPQGATVTIPEGAGITVPEGTTLTNNGTITGQGSLTGEGTVAYNGDISVSDNDFMATVEVSASPNPVAFGSGVTLTATVRDGDASVTGGTVTFYQGDASGSALNGTPAGVTNGTAAHTVDALEWTPGSYTVTAVYVPAEGSGLIASTGSVTLTVNKAGQGTAPEAPGGASSVTASSVTLSAVAGGSGQGEVQYGYTAPGETSVPEDRWQAGITFEDLAPARPTRSTRATPGTTSTSRPSPAPARRSPPPARPAHCRSCRLQPR